MNVIENKIIALIKNKDSILLDYYLSNNNFNIYFKDELGRNILHYFILYYDINYLSILKKHWNLLKDLINKKDNSNTSVLHYCCLLENEDLLTFLLSEPTINVNALDNTLSSPLHLLFEKNKPLNFIKLFLNLSNKINISLKNGFHENILHLTLKNKHAIQESKFILSTFPFLAKEKTLSNTNMFLYSTKYKTHHYFISHFLSLNISPFEYNDKNENAYMYLNEEDIQQIALFEENEIYSLLNNEDATKKEIERL